MTIPEFNRHGFLPPGVHECSLPEMAERFGKGRHQGDLIRSLQQFVANELRPRFTEPIYVGGSFVTDKELPNDVDVTLDLRESTEYQQILAIILMSNQRRFLQEYGVHFWINLPGMSDFTAFFQYAGPKVAYKGLGDKQMKGILRLRDG